jgi:GDP-4-dehydro-6-deoxy-D-mannose reductase
VKVLVTGAAGFVAGHLLEFLRREHPSAEVTAVVRPGQRVDHPGVAVREADLEDGEATDALFDAAGPDRIVHLAGQSSVHRSWEDPAGTLRANVQGLLNILEAVRRRRLSPRVLVVGSAEEYGQAGPGELPLKEDAPLRPLSPYAVSKVAQGFLALQYALSHGLHVVRTRTFQHTGPGRGESFAESSFARQIVEIEGGRPPVLTVGNLDAVRDYADVRDVVRAYWALLDRGRPGEVYNVCTGKGVRMREVLDILMSVAGISAEVRVDPTRLRPSDVPALVGDPARLEADTGWRPMIPLRRTLEDLLEQWRAARGTSTPTPSRAAR